MAIFQKTVEHKYLKQLDAELINSKYLEFKSYFGNPDIQANIRNSKEEQYQEGFLRELFVKILGYKLNPTSNFNLTTEYKNIKDSKKADGAIILNDVVKAVIELKGTNTTDLSKIEAQAFGYKNNQPDCVYVVTSNFEKIRFYIDNAIEHIEFNLFTLSKTDFEVLYLCLSFESIKNGLPKKVKEESLSQEDVITKKLYQDYSLFKRELHQNLVSLNPQFDSLTLFKKSQKLLDRFLFLFFAEDRNLLPPNSVHLVLTDWRDLQERDVEIPLYQRFKKYFEYLNTGYKGKRYDVFAYNGGLFKPDEVLDQILIDDELLFRHTYKLSDYDFASEIDVNILGHIFENSLNELDEINAQLAGETIDKTKTKRKKDGVFYTPKYITKYIVDNTVGKLCSEKKAELQLNEEDYNSDIKRSIKTKQLLLEKLKTYQNWLLQLTICDPACGSGAFLNQALDFLITEHRYIDELQAKLLGVSLILSDVEKNILENNLFGVDLNEESVEIAKLSLWLRTAQPNRKLNDLNNNIKCGNSLIDDPAVAGDKAFNWHNEFPTIFHKNDKKGWHITCATHNSRYSQRMLDYHIEWGDAVWLSEKEEIIVIEAISKIAKDDNLNIIACNVCGDHLHLLLVCEEKEVSHIVQKIKSISARECNIAMGRTIPTSVVVGTGTREHAPLSITSTDSSEQKTRGTAQAHLWTQKYGCKEITTEEQLENTIVYIRNNRVKHGLPELGGSSGGSRGSSNKGACSLVNTMCCSVEHAFRPEYKGGFDVVIGNPPYVQSFSLKEEEKQYIYSNYKTSEYQINTYGIFVEKVISLLKTNSLYGLIIPNYWLSTKYDSQLRKEVFVNNFAVEIVNTYQVFESAIVDTLLLTGQKRVPENEKTIIKSVADNLKTIEERLNAINLGIWFFDDSKILSLLNDDVTVSFNKEFSLKGENTLKDYFSMYQGMKPYEESKGIPSQTREMMNNKVYHSDAKLDETYLPLIGARHIKRYSLQTNEEFIKYGKNLAAPRDPEIFQGERILINRILSRTAIDGVLVSETLINNTDVFNLIPKSYNEVPIKTLFALIVSKLCATYFKKSNVNLNRDVFPKINVNTLETFPIPNIAEEDNLKFNLFVDKMLSLNKELQETTQKFQRSLQRKFNLIELPGKLQDWYLLPYSDFIKELGKKKVKLSLSEEAEWEDYFLQELGKALSVKNQIDVTDKEIDQMVYQLYGLTDEEIAVVEGA
jgi:REP element-mobilizing transposase RayT